MSDFDYSIHYDKMADGSDAGTRWMVRRYVRQMERWLPKDKSAALLEVGPGNGLTHQALVDAGYDVESIEADKLLADRLFKKNMNVAWIPAVETAAHLLSRPERYEFIYAHHVIEHIPIDQQLDFIRAISVALRPGGHFLCETPNALGPVANWFRYGDWTHTSIFTPQSLEFVLAAGGLAPIYVGATLGGRSPSFGQPVKAVIESVVSGVLLQLSRLIQRIHLVGEFRTAGLHAPLTAALLGVGRKP
jgi:SAM-dependent methyltransferase